MLTQIDVDSENAFIVPILGVTPKESLLVRKVSGLNPPDIDLFIGDYARDGGAYQGRRVGKRNVVVIFDLNPNPALGETVSGLRELLYKAFVDPQVDADYIHLTFHDELGRQRYVVGYTEKFETEIFDVDTMCQISIVCPDPYIRDLLPTVMDYPSPTGGWTTVPVVYGGTAETGFETEIYVSAPSAQLTIDVNNSKMVISGPGGGSFATTQVVYANTIRGQRALMVANKTDVEAISNAGTWGSGSTYTSGNLVTWNGIVYQATALGGNTNKQPDQQPTFWTFVTYNDVTSRWAYYKAHGQTSSLIANLSSSSKWLELHSQSNLFRVYTVTPSDGNFVVRKLSYLAAYWGI